MNDVVLLFLLMAVFFGLVSGLGLIFFIWVLPALMRRVEGQKR